MNVFQSTIDHFNAFQQRHSKIGFIVAVIKKYGDNDAGYQAALMAYYSFLSIFPLLLVLTSAVHVVLHNNAELRQKVLESAFQYFPFIGNELEKNVANGIGSTGFALVVGALFTFYGARGVADVFRSTVNRVWEVPRVHRTGFPWSLFRSLRMIVVGGIALIAAPIISGYAASAGHGFFFVLTSIAITFIILFGVFLFLIHTSLPGKPTFHSMWPSALMAAIGLQILQGVGVIIVTRELKRLDSLYGAFAVVLGLLFWLYLQSQVIVYALEAGAVRELKLYPRSLVLEKPTPADKKSYALYTRRNMFHDDPLANNHKIAETST